MEQKLQHGRPRRSRNSALSIVSLICGVVSPSLIMVPVMTIRACPSATMDRLLYSAVAVALVGFLIGLVGLIRGGIAAAIVGLVLNGLELLLGGFILLAAEGFRH